MSTNKNTECVKVVVRCRPLSQKEKTESNKVCVTVFDDRGEIHLKNPKVDAVEADKTFTFDLVYGPQSLQEKIYRETALPIVESVLEGYNGTIFAYGQTGTGKTHTMEGKADPPDLRGIIPRAFEHVFRNIDAMSKDVNFLVRASFLEIYNEEIRDLLSKNFKNKLEIREKKDTGVYVKDLSAFMINNIGDLKEKLAHGQENRVKGATSMNIDSSRSHSIFTITIEISETVDGQTRIRMGKLNLVDLAGSERQSKTHASGDRLKEAININQSLTTLGNVISSLVDGKSQHIPYRDSKLTRLLQDSLGGNTKTVMIANIGPADYNFEESLSTLRYANRAKSIKNKPKINEDPKDAMLRQFQEEIEKLKNQLQNSEGGAVAMGGSFGDPRVVEVEKVVKVADEQKMKFLEEKINREKHEMERQAEMDRKKIEAEKNMAEEKKAILLKELEEKENKSRKAMEKQARILKKIKKMEEMVLKGHEDVKAAEAREKEFEDAQKEIQEREALRKQMEQELKEKEEMTLQLKEKYASQKEEVEDKTKKIKMLWSKLKKLQAENKELDEMYLEDIRELRDRNYDLRKELKLKSFLFDYFIPVSQQMRLQALAQFSEDKDDFEFPHQNLTGTAYRSKLRKEIDREDEGIKQLKNILNNTVSHYYVYTNEGLVPEEELTHEEKAAIRAKSATRKPQSASNRPAKPSNEKVSTSKVEKKEEAFPKARGIVGRK